MRQARRLFAEVSRQSNYLHIGAPTGLTGIITHRSPRPHLLYLYHQTLSALAQLPPNSVYRQSTEALTRHRLSAVGSTVPAGLEEWRSRITAHVREHRGKTKALCELMLEGKGYPPQSVQTKDEREIEWDDDVGTERAEGPRSVESQGVDQAKDFGQGMEVEEQGKVHPTIEDEPALTADQVSKIEHAIGSGLIEEVINVAQGELELVGHMKDAAAWEELEEGPPEGQWDYFQRDRHTGMTQAP